MAAPQPLDEAAWEQIKWLLRSGESVEATRKRTKRSWGLVKRVDVSRTYADYRGWPEDATEAPEPDTTTDQLVTQLQEKQRAMNEHFAAVIQALRNKE